MYTQNLITSCEYRTGTTSLCKHFHHSYEIIFVQEGTIDVQINHSCYTATKGDLIFISYLEEHAITSLSDSYHRYFVTLSPAQLDKLAISPKILSIFKNRPLGFCHVFSVEDHFTFMENSFNILLNEYLHTDEFSQNLIISTLNTLLIHLFRNFPKQFPLYEKEFKTEIYAVQDYIEKHFQQDIKISNLAQMFYINTYYLTHLFKDMTGYSPKQYLVLCRLVYAKELLHTTTLSIHEVAYRCGFKDTNNFIRLFKDKYGITPLKYRRHLL